MKDKQDLNNSSFLLFPFAILFLLVVGIFISIIQVREKTSTQSTATVNSPAPSSFLVNCVVPTTAMGIARNEEHLLELINLYRAQNKLPPLTWSEKLKRAAVWQSSDMMTQNKLSHTDSLGRDIATRLMNCGYPTPAYFGELIDSGTDDSSAIFHAWSHAPAQNKNLLDGKFTEAGIAMVDSVQDYWTLDLGGPVPTSTLAPTPTLQPTVMPTVMPTVTSKPTGGSGLTPTITQKATPKPTIKVTLTPTPTVLFGNLTPTGKLPTPTKSVKIPTSTPRFNPSVFPLPTGRFRPTSTPKPTIDPKFVPNPKDMQVFVSIKLFGIGKDGNPAPRHQTRHVQVGVYDSKNQPVKTGTGFLAFDKVDYFRGIVHLGAIANDTYYVKVIADNSLQTVVMPVFQNLNINQLNVLPEVTLIQGDLEVDNIVDLVDYNKALLCFQVQTCAGGGTKGSLDETASPTPVLPERNLIDFNDNGVIDVHDYNLLLKNYWAATGD